MKIIPVITYIHQKQDKDRQSWFFQAILSCLSDTQEAKGMVIRCIFIIVETLHYY